MNKTIQANELRIGNLFFDEDKTPCYYAGSWQRQDGWIHRDSANNTYKDSQMYPIHLTPEILEKADYRFRMNSYGAYTNEWRHKKTDPVVLVQQKDWFLVKTTSGAKLTSIKYVHQLQNLFHLLTGEELPLTL